MSIDQTIADLALRAQSAALAATHAGLAEDEMAILIAVSQAVERGGDRERLLGTVCAAVLGLIRDAPAPQRQLLCAAAISALWREMQARGLTTKRD